MYVCPPDMQPKYVRTSRTNIPRVFTFAWFMKRRAGSLNRKLIHETKTWIIKPRSDSWNQELAHETIKNWFMKQRSDTWNHIKNMFMNETKRWLMKPSRTGSRNKELAHETTKNWFMKQPRTGSWMKPRSGSRKSSLAHSIENKLYPLRRWLWL